MFEPANFGSNRKHANYYTTEATQSMIMFWVVTPCGLSVEYQYFKGTYCVLWRPPTRPQGITDIEQLTASLNKLQINT
jgi:hypothetical protein